MEKGGWLSLLLLLLSEWGSVAWRWVQVKKPEKVEEEEETAANQGRCGGGVEDDAGDDAIEEGEVDEGREGGRRACTRA